MHNYKVQIATPYHVAFGGKIGYCKSNYTLEYQQTMQVVVFWVSKDTKLPTFRLKRISAQSY